MSGTVWTKFFWSDWSNDPALRVCSLAAQGLWMRMLCIAAEADPTGYVTVNGRPLGVTDIARLAGVTETECESLLAELDRNGVFSRSRHGAIYSRRMLRDAKRQKTNRENGKKGGSPSLRKTKENSQSVNPSVKGEDKPQKPEANSHKESSAGETTKVTAQHRILAADLLSRGKADLSSWERNFLESICKSRTISSKMQDRLDAIALRIGFNIDSAMATWQKRMDFGRRNSQWDAKWGPMPGALGCLVPDDLIKPGDGNGWTEWKVAS